MNSVREANALGARIHGQQDKARRPPRARALLSRTSDSLYVDSLPNAKILSGGQAASGCSCSRRSCPAGAVRASPIVLCRSQLFGTLKGLLEVLGQKHRAKSRDCMNRGNKHSHGTATMTLRDVL